MRIPLRTAALLIIAAAAAGLVISGLFVALDWPGVALTLIGGLTAAAAMAAGLGAWYAYRAQSLKTGVDDLADRIDQLAARQVEATASIRADLADLADTGRGTGEADPP